MKTFKYFLKIEFNRLCNWITIILALLFFALSMYFIHYGADQYKDILENKDNFKKIEQSKAKYFKDIATLGEQGFRILFVPSQLNIFFHKSGAFSDLNANLDVGERLNLTASYKGQHMFREQGVMYADFYGLHILFGSLIAMIYGFLSFRYREYLKILGGLRGFRKIYSHIMWARFLLLGLYFIVVTVAGAGLALVHGISFSGSDFLYIAGYLGLWLLAVLVLFSAGTWIGSIKSNAAGIMVLAVTWVFLFYISPLIVSQAADSITDKMKSIYQLEKEKWGVLMGFENRAIETEGRYKEEKAGSASERKLIESFWNREYKAMQAIEKKMEEEMRDKIKAYEGLTLISPTTFLSSVTCELSSKGFGSLVDFYKDVQDLKHQFCQFYKDKKFYSENKEKG
ncbi:MAG: hypothetical protein GY950_30885, partial [bacterium]|nr:hypothetical protein [bacterium]